MVVGVGGARGDADGSLLGGVADVLDRNARAEMDVRRSRRDRLASIPPDHLLLVAREWVFDSGFWNTNKSVAHVTNALESAAARGSEESGWLLDKLRSKGDIPEFGM